MRSNLLAGFIVLLSMIVSPVFADQVVFNSKFTLNSDGDTKLVQFGNEEINQFEVRVDSGTIHVAPDTTTVNDTDLKLVDEASPRAIYEEKLKSGPRTVNLSVIADGGTSTFFVIARRW